jgi:hypothetical protein
MATHKNPVATTLISPTANALANLMMSTLSRLLSPLVHIVPRLAARAN